jgi:hypothetical protein
LEIHLWLWEYENEQGKRVVSRWRMSEETAKRYKKRRQGRRLARNPGEPDRIDQRLATVAAQALKGLHLEMASGVLPAAVFPGVGS